MLGDAYATMATLKKRFGNIADSNDDTALTSALDSASRGIEDFCGRQFNTDNTSAVRVFHPLGWDVAFVDDFHTTTDLAIKTDHDGDGTFEVTWSASDYELEPLNARRHGEPWPYWILRAVGDRYFPCARRAPLEVTAQWGWASVPSPVVEACLIVAEETFKLKDAPFGVAGYGDMGVVRVRNNPMAAKMLLPYRNKARVA